MRPNPLTFTTADPALNGPAPAVKRCRRRRLNPLVADARRLAQLLGLSVRTILSLDYSGRLPRPIKLGTRTVWIIREIRDWLATATNGIPPSRREWETLRADERNSGRY